jgi:hypothetical protein
MGILELLPPELLTLLTWGVVFLAAAALIWIIAAGLGKILGNFVEDILGWVR